MPLVRAWTRGLSGASGAALLVPGGIVAALVLLALAGSFGRVGGLGQAFSGPAAPSSTQVPSAIQGSARGHGPALLSVVAAPASAASSGAAGGRVAPGGGHVSNGSPAAPRGGGGGGGEPTASTAPGGPGAPGGCSSCTQPTSHQTLIDRVVSIGTSVTSKLPAVGQLTTSLLKQVGTTVDKILPTDRRANVVTQARSTLSQLKLP